MLERGARIGPSLHDGRFDAEAVCVDPLRGAEHARDAGVVVAERLEHCDAERRLRLEIAERSVTLTEPVARVRKSMGRSAPSAVSGTLFRAQAALCFPLWNRLGGHRDRDN